MNKKSIKDINVEGKRCLVRVDFNVPIKDGVITDENRIKGALPTIKYLMEHGAKVVLCSHMGKPHSIFSDTVKLTKKEKKAVEALPADEQAKAKEEYIAKALKNDPVKLTLKPVADRLNELLDNKVTFAKDVIGEDAKAKVAALKAGECVLLENLRFHSEEEGKDEEFCRKLAEYGDIFVNDAFGTAHRAHASTAGVVQYGFIKDAVCGFLIEKELSVMGDSLNNPVRPFVAILGGAKVSDKINVINNLLDKCDTIIIGGGMAYTFFKAKGYNIGNSICEDDKLDLARELMAKAEKNGVNFMLPLDNIVADAFDNNANTKVVDDFNIEDGWQGLDIGPATCEAYREAIKSAKTVVWNGPMGVFEMPTFANGTKSVAESLTLAVGATTIVGGGDSVAAVTQLGYADKVSHVSTGGGASLELLEGKELPGIACLNEKN